jgi:FAD/FMN-containing dehydrogenase
MLCPASIRQMEVVLANGTLLKTSAEEHPDLFLALEGGGDNFGIVTRYDLETFDTKLI